MVDTEFLQSHALFGGISHADLQTIIPLLKPETFAKDEFIVTEGEHGDRVYFICEGTVEVLKRTIASTGSTSTALAVLRRGDSFGEMELIDVQRRSASVKALEDVAALTLSNEDLHKIYQQNAEVFTLIIMNMAREISRRLRNMDALVASSLYAAIWDREGASA